MRILVLAWEYPPYLVGGLGKHVAGLIPALAELHQRQGDLRVDVLTTRYAGGAPVERRWSPADQPRSIRVRAGRPTLATRPRRRDPCTGP